MALWKYHQVYTLKWLMFCEFHLKNKISINLPDPIETFAMYVNSQSTSLHPVRTRCLPWEARRGHPGGRWAPPQRSGSAAHGAAQVLAGAPQPG